MVEKTPKASFNPLVYKSNEFIEGHYKLSAFSQKVAATLISKVDPNGEHLPTFKLSVSEYASLLGISKQAIYKTIDKTTTELKQVVIRLRKPESRSFVKVGLFSACVYDEEDKTVEFEFDSRLDKHLRDFAGNFTRYQIKQIQQLDSKYSIRLYEILRKCHPLKTARQVSNHNISLEELRNMLGLEPKQYKLFKDFRVRVLEAAQSELEQKTDLKFSFKSIRKGRKIGEIQFSVSHNVHFEAVEEGETLTSEVLPQDYDEAVAAMLASAVPELPKDIVTLLASRLDAVAASQAFLSYTKAKQAGKVKDPAAYFLGILKHQEQQAKSSHNPDMDDMSWANRADFDEF
ncbi:replication initiation protein [Zooshikella ganghwensis]|uniref:Replication initiation protein n=1 Tax=Zooshikella ganghwensis TaxID=202772 RepID=A0A4P9VIL2_9GAMM|nr:replication initiation protein [Zooshikella ganghwensis]RDH41492.1 replication initiation protein [Zooshikella ganghwensis]